jgi:hypothetical protein
MKKRIARAIYVTYTVLVSAILLAIFSHRFLPQFFTVREEIARTTSPDAVVDAVTVRSNAGAMSSYEYHVYIVPAGGEPKRDDEVFVAEHVRAMETKWKRPKLLEIRYDEAAIFQFTNFWFRKNQISYTVTVDLIPHSE